MIACPICNHVNPVGTARCEKCDSWLAQAASVGLKPQVRLESSQRIQEAPLTPQFAEELKALLLEGRKLEAIAKFREITGLGLRDSKDVVEALESGRPMPHVQRQPVSVDEAKVVALLQLNQFLGAIKEYRTATGLGLKEAKLAVEAIASKHGITPKQQGCLGAVALIAATIPLAVWCVAQIFAVGRL